MGDYHQRMDTKLLELLVCPVTKGPLIFDREKQELLSRSARLAYPLRDGIPMDQIPDEPTDDGPVIMETIEQAAKRVTRFSSLALSTS